MKLYDLEQERVVLAGIIAFPDYFYTELSFYIDHTVFYSKDSVVHKTIFIKIKSLLDQDVSKVDIASLSHHLNSLNISFIDNVTISEYLESLDLLGQNLPKESFKNAVDLVKLLSIRRSFAQAGEEISAAMKNLPSNASFDDATQACDKIWNEKIEVFENSSGKAVNLFEVMPNLAYERANDRSIYKDLGPLGPHESLNRLCGSLTKSGHISVICAGSGVGKTQFTTHYCMYVAGKHKIPILHLDNGEMSEEEISFRILASYSRVPLHLIESGDWFDNSSCKERVENAIAKLNSGEIRYDYYNVGGKSIEEIITYIKRYYFSEIGRGNKLVINFDYIKPSFEDTKYQPEHQVIGEMVDKLKQLIATQLVFDAKPSVSIITSVQANRIGTVGNRHSDAVVDDESVLSLSIRIKNYCSHLLILRLKTIDELESDPIFLGRHLMKIEKTRNVGVDFARLSNLVELPDGTKKKNYVNFEFDNFKISDKGDLVDLVRHAQEMNEIEPTERDEDLPDLD